MKKSKLRLLVLSGLSLLISCQKNSGNAQVNITNNTGKPPVYTLAWEEDFNGTSLDTTNWYYRGLGQRNDAVNDKSSVSLDGQGNLVLKVYSDTINGVVTHHAGMIATHKLYGFGRFEARASFVNQSGTWSAFWLQSNTNGNPLANPQQAGMEIDVLETLPHDGSAHNNLHWDGYGANEKSAGVNNGADYGVNSSNYHIFALEWTPTSYKFYVDNNLTWTYTANVSQIPEYIILSSECKNYALGSWAGPIPTGGYGSLSKTNTVMKVDYIKYYKLN